MGAGKEIYCTLCPSFHGSTLLSLVLGNHSRILGLGDTVPPEVWDRCGCGAKPDQCEFWGQVRAAVDPAPRNLFPPSVQLLPDVHLNFFAVAALSLTARALGVTLPQRRFAHSYREFLSVCAQHASFDIFIDGFKRPDHYLSLKASGFNVRGVIHLVRDPRAFAASAKRAGIPAAKAARTWIWHHRAVRVLTRATGERVMRVRYEDLCQSPDEELTKLQQWMGVEPEQLQRPIGNKVHWFGNRSMRKFDGTIRQTDKWPEELTSEERSTVERITERAADGYGYRFGLQ